MPDTKYDPGEDGRRCYDLTIKVKRDRFVAMLAALKTIARGRGKNHGNRCYPGPDAQQLARRTLVDIGEDW